MLFPKFLYSISVLCALAFAVPTTLPTTESDLQSLKFALTHPIIDNSTVSIASNEDPSWDWHDYSTVQAWLGTRQVTLGSMVGYDLYQTVWSLLDKNCPASTKWGNCGGVPNAEFQSRCMDRWPAGLVDCTTGIWYIKAKWSNEKNRQMLITATAGVLYAATQNEVVGPTNCFDMAGTKGCNAGHTVRVNFPPSSNGKPNFMHIKLHNG
ncbi:hypothetical protein IQ06DRAFT_380108 [Phaeosphaeriaceae sp. SRC1lsM3a]|nr:hypothetical protein IQ06DRAFT_380108 [Stagonospora sp. SRC1lsM3a]